MAGDAIRHLPRTPPARPRARREPQHDVHALFLVALGVQRLLRAPIDRAHLARERARTQLPRDLEPTLLILRRCHPTQEAQLRPADLTRAKRGIQQRQLTECAIHRREVAQLAPRDPRVLDRIIARPRKPEPLPATHGHHPTRYARERAPQRHRRAHLRDQPRLQIERLARSRRAPHRGLRRHHRARDHPRPRFRGEDPKLGRGCDGSGHARRGTAHAGPRERSRPEEREGKTPSVVRPWGGIGGEAAIGPVERAAESSPMKSTSWRRGSVGGRRFSRGTRPRLRSAWDPPAGTRQDSPGGAIATRAASRDPM